MSLPFFGVAHATGGTLKEKDQKKVDYLTKSSSSSKYSTNKTTYLLWAKYFSEGDRRIANSSSRHSWPIGCRASFF